MSTHIAILNKSWHLTEKLLDGRKTIESRWYKVRTTPWNRIHKGERVYFKNAGENVIACAQVSKVLQFEDLNEAKIREILTEFGKDICLNAPLSHAALPDFYLGRRYCILVFLEKVTLVTPFSIDKKGFGNAAAWITIDDIEKIKKPAK